MENEITSQEIFLKIKSMFVFLRSKWLTILFFGIIGGAIGFAFAALQKTNYVATLTFAFEDESSSRSSIGGLASQLGFDVGGSAGGAFSESNLVELMKSRSLVERALLSDEIIDGKQITLADYYIWFAGMKKKAGDGIEIADMHFPPNADREKFTLGQNEILGRIYGKLINDNLDIGQKDRKISIVNITVTSENELFSKYFAEKLATVVSDFYIATKSKKSLLNVQILQKQVDSVRAALSSAITGVAVANDNTFNLNPALNVNKVPSARRQIDVQANTTILSQLVANLEAGKLTLRKETPLIQIIDKPILPLKKLRTSRIKSLVVGGILAGVFIVFVLLARRWLLMLTVKEKVAN